MYLKRKNRLYLLADDEALGNIYYVEDDTVKKQPINGFDLTTNNPFLLHSPIGWQEEEISFATSDKYKSLNRAFNLGLTFVYEGAQIIRDRQYNGKGFEEVMYMAILKWDRTLDEYFLEYKGKLDLSTTEDAPNNGVKVNSIEGGVLSYLNANDGTTYEIPCDDSNPAIKTVFLDGMNLSETLNYQVLGIQYNFAPNGEMYILPMVFLNNEGDHEGVLYGSPTYEEIFENPTYFQDSANYIDLNIGGNNITQTVNGTISINVIDTPVVDGIPQTGYLDFRYVIASDTAVINDTLITSVFFPSGEKNIPISLDITLQPNEKLFIYYTASFDIIPSLGGAILFNESALKIAFQSRKAGTYSFCLSLYDYYKQVVLKLTDGKYTGESAYLQGRTDLVVTCGDALRNTDRTVIPNYVIASSFEDCFQSVPGNPNVGSGVGLQVRNNVLYCELLSDLYNDDAPIYDLGEISGFKIKVATDIICNTILNGYPDQEYDSNGGKFEVNSEQEWQMPVLSVKKPFDIRAKWRADARGIEQIRAQYTHLDTTDNSGDKEPFLIQISQQVLTESYTAQANTPATYLGGNYIVFNGAISGNYISTSDRILFTFNGNFQQANIYVYLFVENAGHTVQAILFKNGQSIAIYAGNDTDGTTPIYMTVIDNNIRLNDTYEIKIIPFDDGFQTFTVVSATLFFDFLIKPYVLSRLNYDAISGVDPTTFNVELRPKNQILWHGNEIHEILAQQDDKQITLNHAAKNTELSTTLAGVTLLEKAPINVSELARPLGLPYNFEFTTEVPYTFTDLLSMSTAGYFSFIINGVQFFALPRGSLKSMPANNGAQTWTLRAATRNLFTDFYKVSNDINVNFTYNNNMVATSIYSPLHLMKYNFTPQSKYHNIDMHEDWSYHRFDTWFVNRKDAFYTQKWQTSDIIKVPIISVGLGQFSLFVYDVYGNVYGSGLFNVITTTAVKAPYTLQEYDLSLGAYDEGKYIIVVKAGSENVFISEWLEVKEDWSDTFLFTYSHSANELNLPWLAYNGYMQFRCEALFEQWEPVATGEYYRDDYGDAKVLSSIPTMKRNLIVGTTRKVPEWVGIKVNALLLKDKVYIEGEINDKTKHYTRNESLQMETTKYNGNPYLSYIIELVPAENLIFTQIEDVPIDDNYGWHATINAQVFGLDEGTTEITILDE